MAAGIVIAALAAGGIALAARSGNSERVAATAPPTTATSQPSTITTPPSTVAAGGPDLKVDASGGVIRISGTVCGTHGHFDISGEISDSGLSIVITGPVDLDVLPDGTASYVGHMDVLPPGGIPPFVNELSGHAKINRFDGTDAEIELLDGTFGGGATSGIPGATLALPPSRSNPAHQAIPATSGTFC